MRKIALHFGSGFLGLAFIALVGCKPNAPAQSLSTFRTINVERGTKLTLGERLPQNADFCNWSGVVCSFKPGTFGGAKAMSLSKTKSGLITEFHFNYGLMSPDAMNAQVRDYIQRLGKPLRDSTSKTGNVALREVVWSDPATSFELSYKTDGAQVEASAVLSDNTVAGRTQ